jgi:5-methylcytosine-specific restriction endonuclease McrA
MERTKRCKDCGRLLPETREYFGQFKNIRSNGEVRIGYRNSCRECMATNTAAHTAANPEMVQKRNKARLERTKNSGGSYTEGDLARIRTELQNRCRFCDAPLGSNSHIEHLTPVSRGGSSSLRNLTLSCSPCNLAKTNKTLAEFIAWRKERSLFVRIISPSYENPDKPSGKAGRNA